MKRLKNFQFQTTREAPGLLEGNTEGKDIKVKDSESSD